MTVISGERVQIDCPYSGFPIESIVWEKKGVKLPQNHRQIVFPNGTLVIKKIERAVDEDLYRCLVTAGNTHTIPSSSSSSSSSMSSNPHAHRVHDQIMSSKSTHLLPVTSSSQVFIKVMVAPLISPFNAAPNLREGMRSMLTCSVLEGDPPFSFRWTKDDQEVIPTGNIRITSTNEFSSTLALSQVSYEDNGNFTCIVNNPAASTNYTVHMVVKGMSLVL